MACCLYTAAAVFIAPVLNAPIVSDTPPVIVACWDVVPAIPLVFLNTVKDLGGGAIGLIGLFLYFDNIFTAGAPLTSFNKACE